MEYKKLRIALLLLISTIAFGTISYFFIENMALFDAFYMTVITISTVGFSEVKPLSIYGRIITIVIISTGITIGAYTIGMLLKMFVEGELKKTLGRRKLEKQISKLSNHYIICGYGRIGSLICKELQENNIDFVVIENDQSAIEQMEDEKFLFLPMDATSDEALLKAGIMKARGIVTAVKSDADNVYITLTAKGLRSDIFILARTSDEKNEVKLKRAGATRVVSPYYIGGKRMSQVLIRPTVVDFLDMAMMDKHLGLIMEEIRVKEGSRIIGKNIIESNLRKDFGFIIVAIKKISGEMIFNPMPGEIIEKNDIIVVLGKKDDLIRMDQTF